MARMRMALSELVIEGIKSNTPLHQNLLLDPGFVAGGTNIHYLEKRLGIS
jgi:acetyl-CoA carboxylase biotin carboxylase subunit